MSILNQIIFELLKGMMSKPIDTYLVRQVQILRGAIVAQSTVYYERTDGCKNKVIN